MHRDVLDDFVGAPSQQLRRGYNIVPVGYEVTDVGDQSVEGDFLVEVHINGPWWQAYYNLIEQMGAVGASTFKEGPLSWQSSEAFDCEWAEHDVLASDLGGSTEIDADLRYYAAHALPIQIAFGEEHAKSVVLYKNAVMKGMAPVAHQANESFAHDCIAAFNEAGVIVPEAASQSDDVWIHDQLSDRDEGTGEGRGTWAKESGVTAIVDAERSDLTGARTWQATTTSGGESSVAWVAGFDQVVTLRVPFSLPSERFAAAALGEFRVSLDLGIIDR